MFSLFVSKAYAQVRIAEKFGPAVSFPQASSLIKVLLPNVFMIAGVIAFIGVVMAGVRFIQHAGAMEGEKAAQAKGALTSAILGLIIVVAAYFIIQVISTIIGYDILNPTLQN